jgi:hypothetical protein
MPFTYILFSAQLDKFYIGRMGTILLNDRIFRFDLKEELEL